MFSLFIAEQGKLIKFTTYRELLPWNLKHTY
jgi:hypothetical protein